MHEDVLSFNKVNPNFDFLNKVWGFDPNSLDTLDGVELSKYGIALAQYLIFFMREKNVAKAEIYKLERYIERRVASECITDADLLKKLKNKSAVQDYLVTVDVDLMDKQSTLDKLQDEMIYIDGMDKAISELIATIKRELTRRENELYEVRMERRR